MDVRRTVDSINSIVLSQNRSSRKQENLSKCESDLLCCLVGQLNWLCTQTRPDICYEVFELSSYIKHPIIDNILRANKCVKKSKNGGMLH